MRLEMRAFYPFFLHLLENVCSFVTVNIYLAITVFFCSSFNGFGVELTYTPRWHYGRTGS